MTNKEAIAVFKGFKFLPKEQQAVDLAIKALEEVEEWHKLKLICANEGIMVYKARGEEE